MAMDVDTAVRMALEHAAFRNAARDLRSELHRLQNEGERLHPVGRLGEVLLAFGQHLESHFQLEEQEGYLSSSPDLDPAGRQAVQRLLAQHRELQHQLSRLVDGAQRAEVGHGFLSDAFAPGLEGFLGDLAQHEADESEVVQRLVMHNTFGHG